LQYIAIPDALVFVGIEFLLTKLYVNSFFGLFVPVFVLFFGDR
jgi:hypothetical protein